MSDPMIDRFFRAVCEKADALEAELIGVKAELAALKEAKLQSMTLEPGKLEFAIEHWAVSLMAASFAESLGDAKNFAEMEVDVLAKGKPPMLVTVTRRPGGKTPGRLLKEKEAELAEAKDEIARLRACGFAAYL